MSGPYYLGHLVRLVEISQSNPPLSWPDTILIKYDGRASVFFDRRYRNILNPSTYAGEYDVELYDPDSGFTYQWTFLVYKWWQRAVMRNAVKVGGGIWIGDGSTTLDPDTMYEYVNGWYSASIPTTIAQADPDINDGSVFFYPVGITDDNKVYNRSTGSMSDHPDATILHYRNFTDDAPALIPKFTLHYDNPGPPNGVDHVGSGTQDYSIYRYVDDFGNTTSGPVVGLGTVEYRRS